MTKLLRKAIVLVAVLVALSPLAQCEAAVYTKDNMTLSITNGMSVFTNGNETYQLTKSMVTKDGGFDPTGTVYILWMSKSLYWYSPKYQGSNVNLQFLDKEVISLSTNANGCIDGYDTKDGHKLLLTEDQIKEKLGITTNNGGNTGNNGNNTGNNGSNTGNNTNNKKVSVENNTVIYRNNGYVYVLSQGIAVDKAEEDNFNTVYIRYINGNIKFWNYDLQKANSNIQVKLYDLTKESSSLVIDSQSKAIAWYDKNGSLKPLLTVSEIQKIMTNSSTEPKQETGVTYTNNTVIYKAMENGIIKSYTLASNITVDKVGEDNLHTVWIKTLDGGLSIWNYEMQKTDTQIKMHKVTDKCSALVIENKLVTGYYTYGNTVKKPILSETELRSIIHPVTQTTQTAKQTKTIRNYRVVVKGNYTELYNNKDKRVDRFKLKNKKLTYHSVSIKNVKKATFNKNGNVVVIMKSGKAIVINHINLEKTTIAKDGVSYFNYTKKALGKYAVRKSGTRFSIQNC